MGTSPRCPAASASCSSFSDAPHDVVMFLDQKITCEQAREIGRVLGSMGLTARFFGGSSAAFGAAYAKWMKKNGLMCHDGDWR